MAHTHPRPDAEESESARLANRIRICLCGIGRGFTVDGRRHRFANMIDIGSDGLYISMFDEYNEANQIAKTAATSADAPVADVELATLDEDGTECSSNYYLRLTNDGGKMLRGEIVFTWERLTPPTL